MKVIQENKLDVVVRLHTSLPPGKIALTPNRDRAAASPAATSACGCRTAGETEVLIPGGLRAHRLRPDLGA